MTMQLRQASKDNEFSFGGNLGVIQYEIPPKELLEGLVDFPETDDLKNGFKLADHSEKNINRLIPDTETGRSGSWYPLLIMKKKEIKNSGDKEIWLKAALLNLNTGNIALITSTNSHENIGQHGNRWVSSKENNWVIGRYKMFAPLYFWKELVNRVRGNPMLC